MKDNGHSGLNNQQTATPSKQTDEQEIPLKYVGFEIVREIDEDYEAIRTVYPLKEVDHGSKFERKVEKDKFIKTQPPKNILVKNQNVPDIKKDISWKVNQ